MDFFDSIVTQLPGTPMVGGRRDHKCGKHSVALSRRHLFDGLWSSGVSQSGLSIGGYLTPAHILYPAMKDRRSSVVVPENIMETSSLREKFVNAQLRVNRFWKSWNRDYLHLLHNRQKWKTTKDDLKVGELVLIVNEQLARGSWRLARVVQLVKSSPHVRQLKVRTADATVLLRDRTKLVRLELDKERQDIQ